MFHIVIMIQIMVEFFLSYKVHEASAFGIIGGADGPTAIFLAAKAPSHNWGLVIACLVIAIVFITKNKMESTNK